MYWYIDIPNLNCGYISKICVRNRVMFFCANELQPRQLQKLNTYIKMTIKKKKTK